MCANECDIPASQTILSHVFTYLKLTEQKLHTLVEISKTNDEKTMLQLLKYIAHV